MRLKISHGAQHNSHVLSGVGWTPSNELFVSCDDRTVSRVSLTGEHVDCVAPSCDFYVTSMRWLTSVKGGQLSADCLALACSDEAVRLLSGNGRVDKQISGAHNGSVLCVAWSADGSSLLSGGEDGQVKQWSRNGNLRTKLAQAPSAVTSLCWAPDQQRFAYTHGRSVTLQQTNTQQSSSAAPRHWAAHASLILCSDWHPLTGSLLTGGEDGCYKLWTEEGELLFASRPLDFAVSSVRWSPSGLYFAVGSFNLLALCDASGWTYSRHRCSTGSITSLDWTTDGTHLAGGGSNGSLVLGQLIERSSEWQHFTCRLTEKNSLAIFDLSAQTAREGSGVTGAEAIRMEELDFTSPVIEWSFAHSQLVVSTASSCHVFKAPHFSSAIIVELRGAAVELILQSSHAFALVDGIKGVQLYNYEGKLLNSVRLPPGVSLSSLHAATVQLTGELLIIATKATGGGGVIHVLDAVHGRKVCEPIVHPLDVSLLSASASGPVDERKLAFIDRNRDLFVVGLQGSLARPSSSGSSGSSALTPVRLASNIDHCKWSDAHEVLAAITEGHVRCFFLPLAPTIDPDCMPHTASTLLAPHVSHATAMSTVGRGGASFASSSSAPSSSSSSIGSRSSLLSFSMSRVTLRTSSGTLLALHVSPFPLFLHQCAAKGEWSRALRLCRLLSSAEDTRLCWALLYGLSVHAAQLDIAQQAAAAMEWTDKVRSLLAVQQIPSEAGRMGALAAYQRHFERAESIYLAGQLHHRAICLLLDRGRWSRALQLAHKAAPMHVDTVLLARQRHLQQMGTDETLPAFLSLSSSVTVDPQAVSAKAAAELKKEEARKQFSQSKVRTHSRHLADLFLEERPGQPDDRLSPLSERRRVDDQPSSTASVAEGAAPQQDDSSAIEL